MHHLGLDAIVDLPPELNGGLTFHLPLEVFALEHAAASAAHIDARIEAELAVAFRDGLVDPPFYRWGIEQYRPLATTLLASDAAARCQAVQSVAPLGDGLAGAAFHGLIRLGFGALRRDADEIARGLAYL
ncbi:MAG TPA: hypothetical protein PLV68_07300, partial [Ilumatobacteraceae bacterium]|nr:hypothetical protein [Ilumatobacteraceae bacterium]